MGKETQDYDNFCNNISKHLEFRNRLPLENKEHLYGIYLVVENKKAQNIAEIGANMNPTIKCTTN